HDLLVAREVAGDVGGVFPGRLARAPRLAVAGDALERAEGREAGPARLRRRQVAEAVEDVLVDARGEHRRELAQLGLPRRAVGAAGRRARLVGEDRVAGHVARPGLAAVVVEVLEAE